MKVEIRQVVMASMDLDEDELEVLVAAASIGKEELSEKSQTKLNNIIDSITAAHNIFHKTTRRD